MPIRSTFEE